MTDGAHTEGARLWIPDFRAMRRLLRLTAQAEARNNASPTRAAETRGWITAPGTRDPYGIPLTALVGHGRPHADAQLHRPASPRAPAPRPGLRTPRPGSPWTANDRSEDWLRAGQAMQRVLLTATAHGVRTSILHQAMEWPALRDEMRLSQRRCHPQLLIRFGYGPEGRPTPRASTHHTTDAGPGTATPGTSTDSAD